MPSPVSNPRGKWLAAVLVTLGVLLALVALKFRRLDPLGPGPPTRPAAVR